MAHHHRKALMSPESASASDIFDSFCSATTLKTILSNYRQLCELLQLKPTNFPQFYPKLKAKLCSWRAKALWNKFDKRANHKCYNRGKACPNTRILIIGAGPCGLRSAIEAQLLGAKVVVIEKRDRMTRNNVLHLWPFVIHDLRALGAKKFFGKFCAGSIDHIGIRQLQFILLKVALLLGVEIHEGVSFESLLPPQVSPEEKIGWRANILPIDHPVSQYEFDVLIGADGKRNTLEGFKRKEFRGKLAIAITANFINHHTEAEAQVEEISGVAYIFNQKFFKELYKATGIDLENIVYYKDETHYFVMTAKKQSLLNKNVILKDCADTAKLLALENVDREALMEYAREAADFSTENKLPKLRFAVNHCGKPDVAMFDFTSMYAAENASRVVQKNDFKLLMCLVGDSLLEPFWPTGSGAARGFLSSMDACWAIRSWGMENANPLEVLAERESIYRLLGQTTPENLQRDHANHTLDPHSRYPNLNVRSVLPVQVTNLYTSDDPAVVEKWLKAPTTCLDYLKRRKRRESQIHYDTLLNWLRRQVALHSNIYIDNTNESFKDGLALCAIINRYRPDLIDFSSLRPENVAENNQLAFDILEKEYGIRSVMNGSEMAQCDVPDNLIMLSYLTQIYDAFRGEIPYVFNKEWDEDGVSSIRSSRPSTVMLPASVYAQSLSKLSNNQKLSLLKGLTQRTQIPRKRYRDSQGGVVHPDSSSQNRTPDASTASRKYKKRKSGPSPGFVDTKVKELQEMKRNPLEEDFSGRIKDMETKLKGSQRSEKKPHDLLRAIGKIEKTDWNVKEIERKIKENKYGRGVHSSVEKVPKWNRQQFDDKFTAVKKKLIDRERESPQKQNNKYSEIDENLRKLDVKLRNGTVLERGKRGCNKVSAIAAEIANKSLNVQDPPALQKSKSAGHIILSTQSGGVGSEMCHFCNKRVYFMERLTAEGRYFHKGCFRCEYCSTSLRLNNYSFDRDGKYGNRFYCTQHFGLSGAMRTKLRHQRNDFNASNNNERPRMTAPLSIPPITISVASSDIIDTPERVEFENLDVVSEELGEVSHNEMDEDEWTDHNFGTSANELASSDDVSELTDSDDEDDGYGFAQCLNASNSKMALLEPLKGYTRLSRSNSSQSNRSAYKNNKLQVPLSRGSSESSHSRDSSDGISYQEFESEGEDSETPTEGEELAKARELRMQEVRLEVPSRNLTDSGSETEVASSDDEEDEDDDFDEEEEESEGSPTESDNSTEISTDSEFERNGCTVIRAEVPDIVISESVPVKRGYLEEVHRVGESKEKPIEDVSTLESLKERETRFSRPRELSLHNSTPLNRTKSTEGVASKLSLELKKKYLLGGGNASNAIKKSESACALDTRFKSFVDQISQQQKLLNPAPEPSAGMKVFLEGAERIRLSPTLSPTLWTSLKQGKELAGVDEFKHVCNRGDGDNSDRTPVAGRASFSELPKVEIRDSRGELLQDAGKNSYDECNISFSMPDICSHEVLPAKDIGSMRKIMAVPTPSETPNGSSQILKHVSNTAALCSSEGNEEGRCPSSSSSSARDEDTLAALTETELSDWARDEDADLICALEEGSNTYRKNITYRRHQRGFGKNVFSGSDEKQQHICGKYEPTSSSILSQVDDIEFMDVENSLRENESDGSAVQTVNMGRVYENTGYAHYVTLQNESSPSMEYCTLKDGSCGMAEECAHTDKEIHPGNHFSYKENENTSTCENDENDNSTRRTSKKLLELSRERSNQKDLIHEMVMKKLLAEGKSLQDRKARRQSRPILEKIENAPRVQEGEPYFSNIFKEPLPLPSQQQQHSSSMEPERKCDFFSLPDISKAMDYHMETPKRAPLLPMSDIIASVDRIRETARRKARLMSDSELGLSPEEKLKLLKAKIDSRRNVKSVYSELDERSGAVDLLVKIENQCASIDGKNVAILAKDKERRKSIVQAVSDFFHKKSSPSKSSLPSAKDSSPSRHSKLMKFKIPNFRDKSKEKYTPMYEITPLCAKYVSEPNILKKSLEGKCANSGKSDLCIENIEADEPCSSELSKQHRSSTVGRINKRNRMKLLRMAQEIQRNLEEVEVKEKELEAAQRNLEGVLRDESIRNTEEEFRLVQNLLELRGKSKELKSFKKDLLDRAEEIKNEDSVRDSK